MNELIFLVEEDLEGGFTARALDFPIFTEGESIDELKQNINDAVKCHFENESDIPKLIRLHFVREEVYSYA